MEKTHEPEHPEPACKPATSLAAQSRRGQVQPLPYSTGLGSPDGNGELPTVGSWAKHLVAGNSRQAFGTNFGEVTPLKSWNATTGKNPKDRDNQQATWAILGVKTQGSRVSTLAKVLVEPNGSA